ncbi:phosphonate ABC transporter ATP-binding protein [Gemelliphila palaticanis]|uniref:Phosphonate ABC transporter ATP-binding protein n=1 Tax=Gemelliphila palaticanis TaxID=81950 RepID=A0ABX2SZK8_9BACL|nr:phosphonate ABC transporter ATP-binding protein [Gemella palaticanis]MBF0714852.1 phosphonate ABC transporter ATP-binding protein [Gemella palaticanis]NYS46782.1 phosphonate ABC transporter ATP-binding protein [Gemella palaticanis]
MKNKHLKLEDVTMVYDKEVILDKISFELDKGDFVAILGKSGAGKSTLLRCINKLNNPVEGKIFINNSDILLEKGKKLELSRKKIAFIFQDYNVIDNLYTIENVLTPFLANKSFIKSIFNIYTNEEYNLAIKYLTKVGLEKEIFKKTKYLSGGQKQRVAIAKSICQRPEVLLADEPISSLDQSNSDYIMKLFSSLNKKKNITILMNLHDVNIAKKYTDKIIGLKNGKVLFYKDTESVTDDEIKELYS